MIRKILRNMVKAQWHNKNVPFNTIWRRFQLKRYGKIRANAMHKQSMINPRKITLQLILRTFKAS